MTAWSVCCDFDGTICVPDSCDFLLREFAGAEWKALDEAVWQGRKTEREAFPRQIDLLRVPWENACSALAGGVRIREGFPEFVEFCRLQHVPLVVLSSGLDCLIQELLQRAGMLDVPVYAHGAVITGDRWQVLLREGRRLADHCSHCKCAYLVSEQAAGRTVAYIGDGYTDLCPAQRADVLFATGNLARECGAQNRPFIPFETFHDVERTLAELMHTEQDLRR